MHRYPLRSEIRPDSASGAGSGPGNFQLVAVKAACDSISLSQSLPRDAMRKRGLCRRPVSVCLSVTFVCCIQTAEDIVKLLPRPGNTLILVF